MADIDKQDLDEQIEHHQEMLRILRRRLRVQERKEAEYGINVPAEVATEIMTLNERIAKHEADIARLRSIAAEGVIPLAEVEYRAALAQAWEPGKPTVAGAAQLEWVRVRSGIKPKRAEELEQEVKIALAEEAISAIGLEVFNRIWSVFAWGRSDGVEVWRDFAVAISSSPDDVQTLGRAIRLDLPTCVELFVANLSDEEHSVRIEPSRAAYVLSAFAEKLTNELALHNNVKRDHPDYDLFEKFSKKVVSYLATLFASRPLDRNEFPPPPLQNDAQL
jgi:hypothetical protein